MSAPRQAETWDLWEIPAEVLQIFSAGFPHTKARLRGH